MNELEQEFVAKGYMQSMRIKHLIWSAFVTIGISIIIFLACLSIYRINILDLGAIRAGVIEQRVGLELDVERRSFLTEQVRAGPWFTRAYIARSDFPLPVADTGYRSGTLWLYIHVYVVIAIIAICLAICFIYKNIKISKLT